METKLAMTLSPDEQYYQEMQERTRALAELLGVSLKCAEDVEYLRTRARWTPQLEQDLILAHSRGEEVNMCEFGCTRETGLRLLEVAETARQEAQIENYALLYSGQAICDI